MFVISVRHTGTRFLSKALGCEHDHIDRVKSVDDYPLLVSPLRDPKKVWLSWVVRKTVTDLACRGPFTTKDCFIASWKRLDHLHESLEWFLDREIVYVPIDRPERAEQMLLISDVIPIWDEATGHIEPPADPSSSDFWGKAVIWDEWYDEFDFIYDLPMIKRYYRRQE